jgi:hypothetical protein
MLYQCNCRLQIQKISNHEEKQRGKDWENTGKEWGKWEKNKTWVPAIKTLTVPLQLKDAAFWKKLAVLLDYFWIWMKVIFSITQNTQIKFYLNCQPPHRKLLLVGTFQELGSTVKFKRKQHTGKYKQSRQLANVEIQVILNILHFTFHFISSKNFRYSPERGLRVFPASHLYRRPIKSRTITKQIFKLILHSFTKK